MFKNALFYWVFLRLCFWLFAFDPDYLEVWGSIWGSRNVPIEALPWLLCFCISPNNPYREGIPEPPIQIPLYAFLLALTSAIAIPRVCATFKLRSTDAL